MADKTLGLLGLAVKAGQLAVGEENTHQCVRSGKCRLIIVAADASENAKRRADGFASRFGEHGKTIPLISLPYTKAEISRAAGRPGCSMAAVGGAGFAAAIIRSLAASDPEAYGETARVLGEKYDRTLRRRDGKHRRSKI